VYICSEFHITVRIMSSHFNPYALVAITFPFERCELCVVRIIDCIKGVDYAAADAHRNPTYYHAFSVQRRHRAQQIQILFNPHSDFQLFVCSAPAQINIYMLVVRRHRFSNRK